MTSNKTITLPLCSALELDTANTIRGYFYSENGYYMCNGVPDQNRPITRHYIVDCDGVHREVAEDTLVVDGMEEYKKEMSQLKAQVEKLKTIPMKYRRMEFNAQLEADNKELNIQISILKSEICLLKYIYGNSDNTHGKNK